MMDSFGRSIDYLRLSLTERCNLKCIYCKTALHPQCPAPNELRLSELRSIFRASARLDFRKLRLTGGEPLLRKDLEEIVFEAKRADVFSEICMTTNAQGFASRARALQEAGLTRVNISLDSLDAEKYRAITRGGDIEQVFRGIEKAFALELLPLQLNVVLVKGRNDDEIEELIALAKRYPLCVRFIELMPIGELGGDVSRRIENDTILKSHPFLTPLPPRYGGQPAREYSAPDFRGKIGFISPLSHRFCESCNRIRITSDAKLLPCLGANIEIPLRDAIERGDDALFARMREAILQKPAAHHFEDDFTSKRSMNQIGG